MLNHVIKILFLFIAGGLSLHSSAFSSIVSKSHEFKIGVRAYQGNEMATQMWQPTVDYLNQHLPGYHFTLVPVVDYTKFEEKIANATVDFLISDPLFYVQSEYRYGATRIATLERKNKELYTDQYGCVVITRADRNDIEDISDLRNKSIMGVAPRGFAGWLMALREFHTISIQPDSYFSNIAFAGGKGLPVVKAVADGAVDAGTVRTGLLEMLENKGLIRKADFKVLMPKKYDFFPFETSTRLYPEFPFAKLSHVDANAGKQVLITLLKIQEKDHAAKAGRYARWSIPQEYSEVVSLAEELHLEPFVEKITLWAFFNDHPRITISIAGIIGVVISFLFSWEMKNRAIRIEKQRFFNEKQQLAVTLRSIGDGVIAVDQTGVIVLFNRAAEKLTGWSASEALEQPFEKTFQIANENYSGSPCNNSPRKLLDPHSPHGRVERITLITKDSSQLTVEGHCASIFNENKETTGVVITFRDISEAIQFAEQREQLESRLRQSQKMEAIGLMAGGVAHDLNNILAGVIGYPEIMLEGLPPESKQRKRLEAVQHCGQRASAVVADLLTVAKGVATIREPHDLNTLVKNYLHSLEYGTLESRYPTVSCLRNLAADQPDILCSPAHVNKCVMNLVINAMEAVTDDGCLEVYTKNQHVDKSFSQKHDIAPGDYVVLSIQDNGPGISDIDLKHMFEPFYTKKKMGRSGTGLGLTVVWNTMEDHNGKIITKSDKTGTCFQLYFPAAHKMEPPSEEQVVEENIRGAGQHILVVDDEPHLRDIASQMLSSLGYRADSVCSGEQALKFVKKTPVDLLVLDMLMEPGMNGYQTYEEILKLYPSQKAAIVSGFSDSDTVKNAMKLGAQSFIKKPYLKNQLGRVVKNVLQS